MKKILKVFIVFSIIVTLGIPTTRISASSEIQVGDYIEFGSYENEELKWQVIGFDHNGSAILWCASVVDLFAFDGAESGTNGSGDTDSDKSGSNQYFNSNIYEWLNSNNGYVSYSTTRPTSSAVIEFQSFEDINGSGYYDSLAGFLTGFSVLEQSIMLSNDKITKSVSSNESRNYTFDIGTIEEAYSNFNSGLTMNVEGQVFLLSLEELKILVVDHDLSLNRKHSSSTESQYYWLRTPDGSNLKTVMTIDHAGNVFKTDANYSKTGVVPAMTINLNLAPVLSGLGTSNTPYLLDLNTSDQIIKTFNSALKNTIQGQVIEYKNSLDMSTNTETKEFIAREIEAELMASDVADDLKVVYNYYMNQNSLFLHRDLFISEHLLGNTNSSTSKIFTDIASLSNSQKDAITTLTTYGIIDGYPDGTFKPSKAVSRSEVSKIVSLAAQLEQKIYVNEFNDITGDKWFANYVASIKERGIVKGYTDGSFKPYATITFDEMSAIVSRVLKENNNFYTVDLPSKHLNSQSLVRDWASGDVNLLLENELIDNNQSYNGNELMTRIDIVVLMDKLINLIYE